MEKYVSDKNINATFVKVLAERKEMINGTYIESRGLDDLLRETLKKCKKAFQGDMRAVMANNISNYIQKILINENSYIKKYINEITTLNYVKNIYSVLNNDDFEKYITDIYYNNIRYFLEKEKNEINERTFSSFKKSFIISNNYKEYKNYFVQQTENIIENDINNLSIQILDLQAKIEKNNGKSLFIINKRDLNDIKTTTLNFLNDNFYYLAQIYYISFIIKNNAKNFSISFEHHLNNIIINKINDNNIRDSVAGLFLRKFNDFEESIKHIVPNFNNNLSLDEESTNQKNNNINIMMNGIDKQNFDECVKEDRNKLKKKMYNYEIEEKSISKEEESQMSSIKESSSIYEKKIKKKKNRENLTFKKSPEEANEYPEFNDINTNRKGRSKNIKIEQKNDDDSDLTYADKNY